MATKNTRGAAVGTGASAITVVQVSDQLPEAAALKKDFTATGASAAVSVPSGVTGAVLMQSVFGAPTASNVQVEGSNDGSSWFVIGAPGVSGAARYTQVRLNCTSLTGGTSPTVSAVAIVTP